MIRIRVIQKGKLLTTHLKEMKQLQEISKQQLLKIGEKTKDEIINIISQNSKQPASPKGLRNSIKLEPFANGGWGIGNISKLPSYWKAVNWGHGGYSIHTKTANYLRFKDKSGKFIYRKSVYNHRITPMNFVERSIVFLMAQLSTFKLGKK